MTLFRQRWWKSRNEPRNCFALGKVSWILLKPMNIIHPRWPTAIANPVWYWKWNWILLLASGNTNSANISATECTRNEEKLRLPLERILFCHAWKRPNNCWWKCNCMNNEFFPHRRSTKVCNLTTHRYIADTNWITWQPGKWRLKSLTAAVLASSSSLHRENSLPTLTAIPGPYLSLKPVVKRLSTSFIASTTNGEIPMLAPAMPKKKRRKKAERQAPPSSIGEEVPSDLASLCASYSTVADLVADHRRRMIVKHDVRELEARPDLLLVPIDQLAVVYERERTRESPLSSQACSSSMTAVEKLCQGTDLIALPFIDCPLEFDLLLDDLVVQQLWIRHNLSLLSKCTKKRKERSTDRWSVCQQFTLSLSLGFSSGMFLHVCLFIYFSKKKESEAKKIVLLMYSNSDFFICSGQTKTISIGDTRETRRDVLTRSTWKVSCVWGGWAGVQWSFVPNKRNKSYLLVNWKGKKPTNWTKCYHNANGWKERKKERRKARVRGEKQAKPRKSIEDKLYKTRRETGPMELKEKHLSNL